MKGCYPTLTLRRLGMIVVRVYKEGRKMKRRSLLVFGAAALAASAMPALATILPAKVAMPLSIETDDQLLVDQAFHFALDQQFTHAEIPQVLGFEPYVFRNFDALIAASRERLISDPYYRERLFSLLRAKAELEKKFPRDIDAQIRWSFCNHFCAVLSVRQQMMGSARDVASAASMLDRGFG